MSFACIMLIVALGILTVVCCIAGKIARRVVRSRFTNREIMPLDQWHERFYGGCHVCREASEIVLSAFGFAYELEKSVFRPSDRIDNELREPGYDCFPDNVMDIVEVAITDALRERGLQWSKALCRCESIDEIIRCVSILIDKGKRESQMR